MGEPERYYKDQFVCKLCNGEMRITNPEDSIEDGDGMIPCPHCEGEGYMDEVE